MPEKLHIKIVRNTFRRWPFAHGKGVLRKIFSPFLTGSPIFEASPDVLVQGSLSDFTFLWHFTRPTDSEHTLNFALEKIYPGRVFFDVGANFGLWSLAFAHKMRDVYAFDPLPTNIESIKTNSRLNGFDNIEVVPLAVSDSIGEVSFTDPGSGNTAVGRMGNGTLTVPTIALDAFCAERGIERVNLLKIDVEGAEILVLRGATKLLSGESAPTLIFELDPQMPKNFGSSADEILNLVRSFGYQTFIVGKNELLPVPEPLESQVDVIALKHSI